MQLFQEPGDHVYFFEALRRLSYSTGCFNKLGQQHIRQHTASTWLHLTQLAANQTLAYERRRTRPILPRLSRGTTRSSMSVCTTPARNFPTTIFTGSVQARSQAFIER